MFDYPLFMVRIVVGISRCYYFLAKGQNNKDYKKHSKVLILFSFIYFIYKIMYVMFVVHHNIDKYMPKSNQEFTKQMRTWVLTVELLFLC